MSIPIRRLMEEALQLLMGGELDAAKTISSLTLFEATGQLVQRRCPAGPALLPPTPQITQLS